MRRIPAVLTALVLLLCAGCTPVGETTPTETPTEPAPVQTPAPTPEETPAPIETPRPSSGGATWDRERCVSLSRPRISAEMGYSYGVIMPGGSLLLWGQEYQGAANIPAEDDPFSGQYSGQQVYDSGISDVTGVWLGQWAGLALDRGGRLWGFGSNYAGLLWNQEAFITEPVVLMEDIQTAAVGNSFCAAVSKDGSVWIWGQYFDYEADCFRQIAPTQVIEGAAAVYRAFQPSGQTEHSRYKEHLHAVSANGTLVDLGEAGRIMAGNAEAATLAENVLWASYPFVLTADGALMDLESNDRVLSNVRSADCSPWGVIAAVTADGELYAWTFNDSESGTVPQIPLAKYMEHVSCAAAGPNALLAQKEDESVEILSYEAIVGKE